MILFSIPVHECNDVIRDTINNATKYNPGCMCVLHVSQVFADFDWTIGSMPSVLINPTRFHTRHSQISHVPIHFTNYRWAVEQGVAFDQMCVMHTSEMFIKRGMEDYIKNYEYSLWFDQDTQPREEQWPPYRISRANKIFKDLFDPEDPRNYLGNLIEGHWWSRDLFERMWQWTSERYKIDKMTWPFAAEECYFATLGHHLSTTKNYSHPYNCFHHKNHYVDNYTDVDDIIANKMVTFWQPNNFRYLKWPFPSKNLYSIKRINRDLLDPVRMYINTF